MGELIEDEAPEPLRAVVNVRLTDAECRELREVAQAAGLTVSALVRRRALGRKVMVDDRISLVRELRKLALALANLPKERDERSDEASFLLRRVGAAIDLVARQ